MAHLSRAGSVKSPGSVLLVASLGCAITVVDTNIVGVVLPTIAQGLGATFSALEWVIGAYVLCFSSLLLPAGSLADRFGRRKVLLCGLALFTLASLACGAAPTVMWLNVARAAQGVGSAFLLAPALAIIGHTWRLPAERNRAWAIWGGIMGITMVLAPLAGGVISTLLGWRWAFYINIPICLLLALLVLRVVEESRHPGAGKLDIPGIALFISAMFALTWAFILAPEQGLFSSSVLLRLACSLCLFGCFVLVEKRRRAPMLELSLFHARPFIGAVLAMFAYAATAQVMTSLLPLLLQNVEGKSALSAGIGMLPFALAMLIFPVVGRWLAHYLASRWLLAIGLLLVAAGNLLIAVAVQQQMSGLIAGGMTILGSGGGMLNGETQKAIMGTVPHERAGMASGISTTARFSGILLGFAMLCAILASSLRHILSAALQENHLPLHQEAISRLVTGDVARALASYPQQQAGLLQALMHSAYRSSFALMLIGAALFAFCSALFIIWSMNTKEKNHG